MLWSDVDLAYIKLDAGITDDRDDARLTQVLDAAKVFVEQVRSDLFPVDVPNPDVPTTVALGTSRLAIRWHARRKSVEGLVDFGEFGSGRIPSVDNDIAQMLRIGRYSNGLGFA